MPVELLQAPFDPHARLRAHADALDAEAIGAEASFVGRMRAQNAGARVTAMHLEHYPGMTERELERIAAEAQARWDLIDSLILHRVGAIGLGEPIVLCAAWSAHRAAAFEACEYLMEALKQRAPFWKRETLADGRARWVEHNTPGSTRLAAAPLGE
jgi:molybdopterin synthase catalytic subunit